MRKKIGIIIILNFMMTGTSMCQCKDQQYLWKRLVFLRDSVTNLPSTGDQLQELLKYESSMNSCSYRFDSTHALLMQRISVLYFGFSDFANALKFAKQSIVIINSNGRKGNVNLNQLPRTYYLLSRIYDSLGMSTEKIRALDSCVSVSLRTHSVNYYSLTALYSKLEYNIYIGDYFAAIDCATKCESYALEYMKLGEREQGDGKRIASNSFQWKINSLIKLHNYEQARLFLTAKIREFSSPDSKKDLGTLYEQLAEISTQRGDYNEALAFFKRAYDYDFDARLFLGCKQILNNIGYYIYFKYFKDYGKALMCFKKALSLKTKDPSQYRSFAIEDLNIYVNIANVYVEKGNHAMAAKYFDLAFSLIWPGASEKNLTPDFFDDIIRSERTSYLTSLFIDKADAYLREYQDLKDQNAVTSAIRLYKLTDQLLNRIREEHSDLKSKLFWRSETRRLYEHAVDACYASNHKEDAFYFIERSRAVLLQEQLVEQSWLSSRERSEVARIRKKISELEREYAKIDPLSSTARELEGKLVEDRTELNRLMNKAKATNARFFKNIYATNDIFVRDVQNIILRGHQALLECFVGNNSVYSMIVTPDSIFLNKVDKIIYDSLSVMFLSFLSDADLLNRKFDLFVTISSSLYRCIFSGKNIPPGRVVISPDGTYFPYEALVTSVRPLTYFLEDKAVSYTYSARFLLNDFDASSTQNYKDFIGIAPVRFSNWANLASLEGSDLSLARIGSNFRKADNFIGFHASKSNFDRQFYKYRIIQLYTHASATSQYSEPVFWFADSTLYLSDLIGDQQPATRLIVLSACETGKGQMYVGEGIFSFNRGFAAIGIPTSITNLWVIENKSNYRITELFYRYLAEGLPIDICLQKAKKEFIATSDYGKLPYYWAGSILMGKTNAIDISRKSAWKWILFFTGLGLIFGLSMYYMKKRTVHGSYLKNKLTTVQKLRSSNDSGDLA